MGVAILISFGLFFSGDKVKLVLQDKIEERFDSKHFACCALLHVYTGLEIKRSEKSGRFPVLSS